ncbi:hypothetical protein [Paracidobacterium acidisoli]|uniref:Uncharacterized protein n=1 Tax=Paracidobacterium acidisoli TaxID=2303751 RepID=A0A372IRP2_9BACT|nr:hypothetical protein [Paracidobacterium acidisoli]MBT9330481.1 hypothetical protein [Paracidobacterium acidisoli]
MSARVSSDPRQLFLIHSREEEPRQPSGGRVFRGLAYAFFFNFLLLLGVFAAWHTLLLLLPH